MKFIDIRNKLVIQRTLSLLSLFIGIFLIFLTIKLFWEVICNKKHFNPIIILSILLITFIGAYGIYLSIKAWVNISAIIINRISFIITLMLCSLILAPLLKIKLTFSDIQYDAWMMLVLLITVIIAGYFYAYFSKFLIRRLGLVDSSICYNKIMLKQYFGFVAALLWGVISFFIIISFPTFEPFSSILMFALLIFIYLLYNKIYKYYDKNKTKTK